MAATTTPPQSNFRDRFQKLAAQWKAESQYMSNVVQMAILQSYQSIVGMGEPAVTLILEELRREPDQWFWALEAITQENPVPSSAMGDVDAMAKAWIEWGIQNGYIAP